MAKFLRGFEPSITEKVDIQPYWSFKDVCKLAVKVEKYSKGKRVFNISYSKPTIPLKPYVTSKPKLAPKVARSKDKGKTMAKEFPKQLEAKRCSKCQGYRHFQANCLNIRVLTLKEIEEIDHFALELAEEEEVEEKTDTVLAPDVGQLLVLQRPSC